MIAKILQAARAGNWKETCAAFAGIHVSTLWAWLARGDKWLEGLAAYDGDEQEFRSKLDPLEREFLEFSEAFALSRAEAEVEAVLRVNPPNQNGAPWQSRAWWLERSFPERWGRRVIQKEISGPGGGPIQSQSQVAVVNLTPKDKEVRLARMRELVALKVKNG